MDNNKKLPKYILSIILNYICHLTFFPRSQKFINNLRFVSKEWLEIIKKIHKVTRYVINEKDLKGLNVIINKSKLDLKYYVNNQTIGLYQRNNDLDNYITEIIFNDISSLSGFKLIKPSNSLKSLKVTFQISKILEEFKIFEGYFPKTNNNNQIQIIEKLKTVSIILNGALGPDQKPTLTQDLQLERFLARCKSLKYLFISRSVGYDSSTLSPINLESLSNLSNLKKLYILHIQLLDSSLDSLIRKSKSLETVVLDIDFTNKRGGQTMNDFIENSIGISQSLIDVFLIHREPVGLGSLKSLIGCLNKNSILQYLEIGFYSNTPPDISALEIINEEELSITNSTLKKLTLEGPSSLNYKEILKLWSKVPSNLQTSNLDSEILIEGFPCKDHIKYFHNNCEILNFTMKSSKDITLLKYIMWPKLKTLNLFKDKLTVGDDTSFLIDTRQFLQEKSRYCKNLVSLKIDLIGFIEFCGLIQLNLLEMLQCYELTGINNDSLSHLVDLLIDNTSLTRIIILSFIKEILDISYQDYLNEIIRLISKNNRLKEITIPPPKNSTLKPLPQDLINTFTKTIKENASHIHSLSIENFTQLLNDHFINNGL